MKNHMQFTEGELTIYCGENTRDTVFESLKHAEKISRKEKVLFINTVYTRRRILSAARKIFLNGDVTTEALSASVFLKTTVIGDLCQYFGEIAEQIKEQGITCLIIDSWEFANRTYGYKERTLYGLLGLMDLGVSVLVYSQSHLAEAGKIQRAGLGKLAALADAVISLPGKSDFPQMGVGDDDDEFDTAKTNSTAPPHAHTPIPPAPSSEMLVASKINELDYARSETHVASGGELVVREEEVAEMRN